MRDTTPVLVLVVFIVLALGLIRHAYLELAGACHPDLCPDGAAAGARFKQVHETFKSHAVPWEWFGGAWSSRFREVRDVACLRKRGVGLANRWPGVA
jgi:hypothetical protein